MDFEGVRAVINLSGSHGEVTGKMHGDPFTARSNMEVAMLVSPTPAEVRWIVEQSFQKYFNLTDEDLEDLVETPMIDDGRCIARSYRVTDFLAMWLQDVGILQFYDQEGSMLRRANLFAEIEPPPADTAQAA
jgi:hypothetical protein